MLFTQQKGMSTFYKDNKKWILAGVSIIIVAVFISSAIFVYMNLPEELKPEEEEQIEFVVDDQISPLSNQGICLEILRIRHRGIMEKMRS